MSFKARKYLSKKQPKSSLACSDSEEKWRKLSIIRIENETYVVSTRKYVYSAEMALPVFLYHPVVSAARVSDRTAAKSVEEGSA